MIALPEPTMTPPQAARLLSLLAELHEKAYRRGFQQGHASGTGEHGPPPPAKQVAEWRFRGYADAEPPPHGRSAGDASAPGGGSHVERMLAEAAGDLGEWLHRLRAAGEPKTVPPPELISAADLMKPTPARSRWEEWQFDPVGLTLACDGYEIDLEEIASSAAILDWVFQVAAKAWATPQVIADLMAALDEVLQPQANFCPGGMERNGIGANLARAHAVRVLGHRE